MRLVSIFASALTQKPVVTTNPANGLNMFQNVDPVKEGINLGPLADATVTDCGDDAAYVPVTRTQTSQMPVTTDKEGRVWFNVGLSGYLQGFTSIYWQFVGISLVPN